MESGKNEGSREENWSDETGLAEKIPRWGHQSGESCPPPSQKELFSLPPPNGTLIRNEER